MKRPPALVTAGVTVLLGYLAASSMATFDDLSWRWALTLFLPLLAIPSLVVVGLLGRSDDERRDLWLIALVALAIRVLFLVHEPYFSDDVYRYLWDGRVWIEGQSPYGVAPSDEDSAIEAAETPERRVRHRVNHPDVPTIYPPALQVLFAASAGVDRALRLTGPGLLLPWRMVLLAFEAGIFFALISVLRARGRDTRLALLYAWHPLAVVEGVWSAHAEIVAVFFLVAAVSALVSGRPGRAGLALGVGGAAKLLPLGLWPFLWRRSGIRAAALAPVAAAGIAAPVLLVEVSQLSGALGGASAYAESWYYNDLLFHLFGAVLGIDVEDRTLAGTQALRVALVATFVLLCLGIAWRQRDPVRAALWLGGGFVILTPTLHPWYLLWVLPFAILGGSRGWLALTVTVLFSHVAVVQGRELNLWQGVPPQVRALEFIPPLAVLAWDSLRRARASHDGPGETP